MSSLTEVREAIAVALATIGGLQAHPGFPPQVHPPAAILEADSGEFHTLTMDRTQVVWHFNLTVLVAGNDVSSAQAALDAYLAPSGASSIREALETDTTLGDVVDDLIVRGWSGYQAYTVGEGTFWGVRFEIEVR